MAIQTNEKNEERLTQAESKKMGEETASAPRRREGSLSRPGRSASLKSDRGTTSIADTVVEKVAGIAAREVRGVYGMGGGTSRAIGAVTQRVGLGDERSQGVSVEVGERETAIDLTVVMEYGESIPQVAEQIRENVVSRIEGITGLSVTEVNIAVNDLHFEGEDESSTRVS
jgi:uncharacterized alkaline shock family protein YloU